MHHGKEGKKDLGLEMVWQGGGSTMTERKKAAKKNRITCTIRKGVDSEL